MRHDHLAAAPTAPAWFTRCGRCELTGGPFQRPEALELGRIHDLVHHGGSGTSVLHERSETG